MIVAALVFLGPGALRPATTARVRGLPAEGARAAALRIEVVQTYYDVVDAAAARDLVVEASAPGQSLTTWRGAAGTGGIVDVTLTAPSPLHGPLALKIAEPGPRGTRLLAGGEITLRHPPPAFVQLGAIAGTAKGDLVVRVDAARGVMASPFPETLRISVSPSGADVPLGERAELELSGAGMDLVPDRITTDERGSASVQVKALAHNVELTIAARAGDKRGRWEGRLPVIPGAIWLDPASPSGVLSLVSPSPRDRAFVSLWSEEGRLFGAVVPLVRDGYGFFRGEVRAPSPPAARLVYATVAGDALEQGSGTVAWPLRPAEGAVTAAPGLPLLLDGVPAALAREQQRAWAARRTGLMLIGAAALAEMLLLLLQSRASQRRLEAHLASASAAGQGTDALPAADRARLMSAAREHPVLRAVLLVSLVGLAFAMVAALATFR
ncbi:hypothetical protein A7982_12518 [Minicystis rosea]|nr:hypothetical protein A7982_12518 [Minicystis rosea]